MLKNPSQLVAVGESIVNKQCHPPAAVASLALSSSALAAKSSTTLSFKPELQSEYFFTEPSTPLVISPNPTRPPHLHPLAAHLSSKRRGNPADNIANTASIQANNLLDIPSPLPVAALSNSDLKVDAAPCGAISPLSGDSCESPSCSPSSQSDESPTPTARGLDAEKGVVPEHCSRAAAILPSCNRHEHANDHLHLPDTVAQAPISGGVVTLDFFQKSRTVAATSCTMTALASAHSSATKNIPSSLIAPFSMVGSVKSLHCRPGVEPIYPSVPNNVIEHRDLTGSTVLGVDYVGPFILGKVLGKGTTGTVRLGVHKHTGFQVAFKIIEKKYLDEDLRLWKKLKREIAILKLIEHPHVLKLYDVLETEHRLYLVLEYVEGGELFELITSHGRLEHDETLRLTSQIIMGLEACHAHSICHRDLKPENLLLDGQGNVRLADFGMGQLMKKNALLRTCCGSPHYASPEVIEGFNYDAKISDVWSIGVILFALITGSLPFDHSNIPILLSLVIQGHYEIPQDVPKDIADLISKMLTVDPRKRIRLSEIRLHFAYQNTHYFYLALPIPPEQMDMDDEDDDDGVNDEYDAVDDEHADDEHDSSDEELNVKDNATSPPAQFHLDDRLLNDLESLGFSPGTREELRRRVSEGSGIECMFYRLLMKRKKERLRKLALLSPRRLQKRCRDHHRKNRRKHEHEEEDDEKFNITRDDRERNEFHLHQCRSSSFPSFQHPSPRLPYDSPLKPDVHASANLKERASGDGPEVIVDLMNSLASEDAACEDKLKRESNSCMNIEDEDAACRLFTRPKDLSFSTTTPSLEVAAAHAHAFANDVKLHPSRRAESNISIDHPSRSSFTPLGCMTILSTLTTPSDVANRSLPSSKMTSVASEESSPYVAFDTSSRKDGRRAPQCSTASSFVCENQRIVSPLLLPVRPLVQDGGIREATANLTSLHGDDWEARLTKVMSFAQHKRDNAKKADDRRSKLQNST